MDNLTYWQTRTLRTQERLAKKTESDVKKQLVKYYRKSAERIIKDLNQIVAKQADVIDLLSRQVRYLSENFDASGAIKPLSEETPPPHY